jgi:hypothetical protein
VVSALTIESEQHQIQGLMTTYGYVLTHPEKADRLNIWFTDGSLEVVHKEDALAWYNIFKGEMSLESDGKMSYHLPQPVHRGAYVDFLYLDETLRIVRSSDGLVYALSRVPYFPDE